MGNIPNNQVICKCLDLLDLSDERDKTLDFRAQKLTVAILVKLMVDAQLRQLRSYAVISEHLYSSASFQEYLGLESISKSQISRKLRTIPYTFSQALFLNAIEKIKHLTANHKGIPGLGRLSIVDSTSITLPEIAGQWAYCSKTMNGVKMHTRLLVTNGETSFPDRIIASTADVADHEVVMDLVVDENTIHILDRGYISYWNYKVWVDGGKRFVARIKAGNQTEILRERPVPESCQVLRDADVRVTAKKESESIEVNLRLVEFKDHQGKVYRVVTSVYDLTAEQISDIYRHRWTIELFFKWVKQHLKLVKLYSVDPEAVWTQMYLALTAYALVLIIKLETGTKRTAWKVLELLCLHIHNCWETFLQALFREPTRKSKGRQKKAKRGRPRKHPVQPKRARIIVK